METSITSLLKACFRALTCRAGPNSPIASRETINSLKNQCLFIIKIDLNLCLLSKFQGFGSTG
ncbi:MAG: hypothetical protein EBY27_07590 [Synechococcaceae bacterium WB8_3_299]|nr:hypothetical protein [Synechococcaceae bacterium WB8_3_299]